MSSGSLYSTVNYVTCDNFSTAHRYYLSAITKIVELKFYHEVVKDPNQREAMTKEIRALELKKT